MTTPATTIPVPSKQCTLLRSEVEAIEAIARIVAQHSVAKLVKRRGEKTAAKEQASERRQLR
jgi:predicted amidophosphoribosyltransferase